MHSTISVPPGHALSLSSAVPFTCLRHVSALGPVQTRLHDPPCGSRMSVEMSSGSDGSALEVTATVRAPATEAHLDAPRAPGALEGADHRLRRLGRKVDVAAFAARTQLQHAASLPANRLTRNKRLVARGASSPSQWSAHLHMPIGPTRGRNADCERRGARASALVHAPRGRSTRRRPLLGTSGQRQLRMGCCEPGRT